MTRRAGVPTRQSRRERGEDKREGRFSARKMRKRLRNWLC